MRVRSIAAALAAAALVVGFASVAHAQSIAYAPCEPAGFECGQLGVPLDRGGIVPGTVTLSIERVVAASNPARTAVVALAGGPGQAALPAATEFASLLAPALATRDLVVFDQRGTGASDRLTCRALETGESSIVAAARACANEIGPARGFYRTADSVDDIEAIRAESGYDKLVLFGVSYGTKVAEDYAAKYPQHVEAMVLDSVVPPEGSDVFNRSTFHAMGRALGELCAGGACNGITTDPLRDLSTLVRKAGRASLRGTVNSPGGRPLRISVDQDALFSILVGGDLNPTLRAELPGAMRSAIRGDRRPLLRLYVRAAGLTGIPTVRAQDNLDTSDSDAVFLATRCEESTFPWDRDAGAEQRAQQAVDAARALPTADTAPFNYKVALRDEAIPVCLGWPNATPAPAPPAPLPQVPTLIISGDADLRTPLEDGQLVASRIPGAQVLGVPFAGHSVLGSDTSHCAQTALAAFFAGQPVAPCSGVQPIFAPTPVAPSRLSRVPGRTKALKTVAAVSATVDDVRRQFIGDQQAAGRPPTVGAHVAGLRSGRATATRGGFSLRDVVYVPGVDVSGHVPTESGSATLTVSGRAAAKGRLTFRADGAFSGRLDGRRVSVGPATRAARALAPRSTTRGRLAPFPRIARLG
jgi:pimeloyl-ACP methyl ester carboxylesterase